MAEKERSKKRTVRKATDGMVVVGSEIGVSLPIGDTFAHIRFSFWSERLCRDDRESVRKTAAEVDEFNERELDRRLSKHVKMVRAALRETYDEDDDPKDSKPKSNKVSVRDRAQARLK